MAHGAGYLLVDANVLIDYVASDISVLTLASRHLGRVYVVSIVVDEVAGLTDAKCRRLGIEVIEPELSQLTDAAVTRGPRSTQDNLCLIIARTYGWTCVTNDGALRKACVDDGVRILWGLEIMTELARRSALSAQDAIAVAKAIV